MMIAQFLHQFTTPPVTLGNNSKSVARFSLLYLLALIILLFSTQPALAATITVSNSCSLANAIRSANTDTATGGCPAGSGDDTIILRSRVTLSAALPIITNNLTITGGGTIDGNNAFRVLHLTGGHLQLNNMTITRGRVTGASDSGAGIYIFEGTTVAAQLSLTNTTVSGNTATGANSEGGGIYIYSEATTVTITGSAFHNNSAASGGALHAEGGISLTIDRSSFYGNTVTGGSGIIYVYGYLDMKNSTMYGNTSANTNSAAIYALGATTGSSFSYTLSHVTVYNNTLAHGFTGTHSHPPHNVYNSILAGASGNDCNVMGGLTGSAGNLIEDNSCSPALNGNPQLASRASGRHYFPPQANSPLIDAAESAHCESVDQRGMTRPQGNACDIGAIEWVPSDSPTRESADRRSTSSGSSDEVSNPAPARAPVHSCQELDADQSGLSVWAQHGLYSGIQCQRRDLHSVHVIQAPNIGAVINAGIQDVIEIWGFSGQSWEICADNSRLGAFGGLMFIEKTPGLEQVVHTAPGTVNADGETCLKLHDKKGYVVLVANAPTPASLPASAAPYRATLSLCMVQTNYILNLRETPGGAVLRHIPFNVTLTAFHRTDGWFYVDYHGERGWLNAGHVTEIGACG